MATLTTTSGRCVVQFDAGGTRKTVSFGAMSRRNAEAVRGFVSDAEHAAKTGTSPRPSTSEWLASLSAPLHAKLAAAGLCRHRADAAAPAVELVAFLDGYLAKRTDLKPGTHVILKRVRKSLVAFFGKRQDVGGISKGEAADWQRHVKETYSQATAHLYAKKARQFFADAADRHLVKENPFRKLKLGTSNNPDRLAYVRAADVLKVIDATPDPEWKLVFALPRFAACRIPSEVRGLKWSDVAFDARRMTLRSPKTEHHEGRASRVVPIAPELLPLLLGALEAADEGAVYVLPRLRHVTNLATTAQKLIDRAGVSVWVKTFQNLRSSCETDWAARFPIHVACAWAGNTQAVAAKHYLQVTDDHFGAASGAADDASQCLPMAERDTQNRTGIPAEVVFSVAPEGPQPQPNPLSEPSKSKTALRPALQTVVRSARLNGGKPNLRRAFRKIRRCLCPPQRPPTASAAAGGMA